MADQPAPNGNGGAAPDTGGAPSIQTLAQYLKDLSFENPHAPHPPPGQSEENQPQMGYQVNVNANQLAETDFEVELTLEGGLKLGEQSVFVFDIKYAGVFRLVNMPAEHVRPVVMVECPRLLFPFARQIVADAVRNGGFQPFYIEPVDFAGLYQQRGGEAGNA